MKLGQIEVKTSTLVPAGQVWMVRPPSVDKDGEVTVFYCTPEDEAKVSTIVAWKIATAGRGV